MYVSAESSNRRWRETTIEGIGLENLQGNEQLVQRSLWPVLHHLIVLDRHPRKDVVQQGGVRIPTERVVRGCKPLCHGVVQSRRAAAEEGVFGGQSVSMTVSVVNPP